MSDTPDIITLQARLETANTRITELEQENRYLDSLNYELQFLENKLILELKEENAKGALYVQHLKARIAELEKKTDHSSFPSSPPITSEVVKAMEDIWAVSAKVPFKPFPSSENNKNK